MSNVQEDMAAEALRIVQGARKSVYGGPEDNFARIANYWQAYFNNTGRGMIEITAADVSPMMRLMKEARLNNSPSHYDSFVDLIGYALTGALVNEVEAPRPFVPVEKPEPPNNLPFAVWIVPFMLIGAGLWYGIWWGLQ